MMHDAEEEYNQTLKDTIGADRTDFSCALHQVNVISGNREGASYSLYVLDCARLRLTMPHVLSWNKTCKTMELFAQDRKAPG